MYRTKEKLWVIFWFFCMVMLAGCEEQKEEMTVLEEVELEKDSEKAESGDIEEVYTIFVYVCGQVVHPGVYEMDEDSRVYEVIQMAGGMTELAAADYVNQAELLEDGQKVYVPSMEDIEQGEAQQSTVLYYAEGDSDKVNINLAGKEDLMVLTGIGEKRAEAILTYRQLHGSFSSIEELMQVEGIKQGTYDKIKDQITVS